MPSPSSPGISIPPRASLLPPGTIIAERYNITSVLGEGGMGAVYCAEHVHMKKLVAVKVLHEDMSNMPEIVARFEREAVAAGNIEHPNVAAATDFGRLADGKFFLVLEYVAGQSLRTLIDQGPVDATRAIRILRGILGAIGAAHAKGIVHRDLKPENVMLVDRPGEPDFVKVLDFGIAKLDVPGDRGGGQPITRMGAVFGTPDYMAPEQAMGEAVDGRADLYATGVLLYELLSGERPFRGGAVTVLRQHVLGETPPLPEVVLAALDPRVNAVLARLLAKNKDERYASAADVLAALDEAAGIPPSTSLSTGPVVRVSVVGQDAPTSESAALFPTVMARTLHTAPNLRKHVTPVRVAVAAGSVGLFLTLAIALTASALNPPTPRPHTATDREGTELTASAVTSAKPAFNEPVAPGGGQSQAAAPAGKPVKGGGRRFDITKPSTWLP